MNDKNIGDFKLTQEELTTLVYIAYSVGMMSASKAADLLNIEYDKFYDEFDWWLNSR